MFFSRKAKMMHSTLEELRREIESVRIDLEVLKDNVEEDIANIRKDFRELVHFLGESASTETEKNEPDMAAQKDAHIDQHMTAELGSFQADLAHILSITKEMRTEVDGLKENIQSEVNSIKTTIKEEVVATNKKLDDVRKDIKNKISYSLSRLRA